MVVKVRSRTPEWALPRVRAPADRSPRACGVGPDPVPFVAVTIEKCDQLIGQLFGALTPVTSMTELEARIARQDALGEMQVRRWPSLAADLTLREQFGAAVLLKLAGHRLNAAVLRARRDQALARLLPT